MKFRRRRNPNPALRLLLALPALLVCSCQQPTLIEPEPLRDNRGIALTIRLEPGSDTPPLRAALDRFTREWSASTGATVVLDATGTAPSPSIRIFPAADLSDFAASLRTVPMELRSAAHPWYRWADLIPWIGSRMVVSDGVPKAMPLLGEGQVLFARSDSMAKYGPAWLLLHPGRPLELPATWEEFAEQAEFYSKQIGRPAFQLAPDDLERLFYSIAIDYDRFLLTESARGSKLPTRAEEDLLFGWLYNPSDSKPRIDSPAFVHALTIVKRLKAIRADDNKDRAVAVAGQLAESPSALGILTLPQLADLLREPANRPLIAVGPLPGAGFVFDPVKIGEKVPVPGIRPNRVPYLGWGTVLGGVSDDCPHPEAAFDFLARMGHPSETALSLVSDGSLGAGPIRTSQVEAGRPVWSGYRLPTAQTDRLVESLRPSMARGVINARFVLRLPDHRAKSKLLRDEMQRIILGNGAVSPQESLRRVRSEWEKLDTANPDLAKQLRRSLNL